MPPLIKTIYRRDIDQSTIEYDYRLEFQNISNLPKFCSSCRIYLSDTSLIVYKENHLLHFKYASTGSNAFTPIAYTCFPPLPNGITSSGGGDAVNHWDTLFTFQCISESVADTLTQLLNVLKGKKKLTG